MFVSFDSCECSDSGLLGWGAVWPCEWVSALLGSILSSFVLGVETEIEDGMSGPPGNYKMSWPSVPWLEGLNFCNC